MVTSMDVVAKGLAAVSSKHLLVIEAASQRRGGIGSKPSSQSTLSIHCSTHMVLRRISAARPSLSYFAMDFQAMLTVRQP